MGLLCLTAALFIISITRVVSGFHIANRSSLNCSQKGLLCEVNINNCIYQGWFKQRKFTPTAPVELKVDVDVKTDENGNFVPVIVAQWKARDDGSIVFLSGTELQVTKLAGGGHLCIHYIFLQKFQSMKNPNGELWTFSLDKVVVGPGEEYVVSVANLPKPNLDQTSYNIATKIRIPGCTHPAMQQTQICFERGEYWQPNITMVRSGLKGRRLSVTFKTDKNSDKYNVAVKCGDIRRNKVLSESNSSSLNITFDLEDWPLTCCSFITEIQPFFEKCGNDCKRQRHSFNICSNVSPTIESPNPWRYVGLAGLIILIGVVCASCAICHRIYNNGVRPKFRRPSYCPEVPVAAERSVLIIYSRDHPKYTDIVLKLCAFLRAKCGTEVYLDLLDTASIGAMGRLQWTEYQKRRMENSSNKVLVLCSRGVQAKWGAMCGGHRVLLREDVCSPMGDMLTYALQLITPDFQQPASYGKYLVAYFEDISAEYDVPSMFDISIKYKLMKQFEELFFRILDLEKYQRQRVHTIAGIGIDEYFNCPSGKALRDAVEIFRAYQLENPDWFEKECVDSEEEALLVEMTPLIDQPMILHCEPVVNDGPSVCECEVKLHDMNQALSVCTTEIPHLNLDFNEHCVQDLQPANILYPAVELPAMEVLPGINIAVMCPHGTDCHSCHLAEPVLRDYLPPSKSGYFANMQSQADDCSVDDHEKDLENLLNLQRSLASSYLAAPPPSLDDHNQTSWDMHQSQPIEMDETEVPDTSGNRQSRWSDQGYSSRDSIVKEEPQQASLVALAKLQEMLYLNSPISSGFCTETIES